MWILGIMNFLLQRAERISDVKSYYFIEKAYLMEHRELIIRRIGKRDYIGKNRNFSDNWQATNMEENNVYNGDSLGH